MKSLTTRVEPFIRKQGNHGPLVCDFKYSIVQPRESQARCDVHGTYCVLNITCDGSACRNEEDPIYTAPELLATAPKQLWSWDITKLKGPTTWSWYHRYVILDVFSRYVDGWMIAPRETAALAERLITASCERHGIPRGQLTLHADRGSSMTSKPVALLLADLGVTKTHSRPHVSNDNPHSETQFNTLKYRPDFPGRYGSIQHARAFGTDFFPWYNTGHRHSRLGLHTPHDVPFGLADAKRAARAVVLAAAYAATPERFVNRPPTPAVLPTVA